MAVYIYNGTPLRIMMRREFLHNRNLVVKGEEGSWKKFYFTQLKGRKMLSSFHSFDTYTVHHSLFVPH